jgi:hypothetical protein
MSTPTPLPKKSAGKKSKLLQSIEMQVLNANSGSGGSGNGTVQWAKNNSIASTANVERAYWGKIEFPDKTVVLVNNLSFHEYCVLTETHCRQLSKLKLEFEPYQEIRPDWGKIVVKASKTFVHGIPGRLLSDIATEITLILQNGDLVAVGPETPIPIDQRHSREPDAHLVMMSDKKDYIVVVLESAYSETVVTSLEEFQDELADYFVIHTEINVVIGVYIPYVAPGIPQLPVPLSMSLIVLHRGNAIAPQVIPFGEDADHTHPIQFTIDTAILFANTTQVPGHLPRSLQFDVRKYYPRIRRAINDLRDTWKAKQENPVDDDSDYLNEDYQQKKRKKRKRKSSDG